MRSAGLTSNTRIGTRLPRVLLITNFVLLLALIGPGSSHSLYLTETRLGVAHIIVRFLQVWFIASTIPATLLFIRLLASKSAVPNDQGPQGWIPQNGHF